MKYWPLLKTLALGCLFALELNAQSMDTTDTLVAERKLGEAVQLDVKLGATGSFFAPYRYGDRIYFTASLPPQKTARLYSMTPNGAASLLSFNPKEEDVHVAHTTLNATSDRIYYTSYKESVGARVTQSEICYRDKQYDGTWGNVVKLPKHVNKLGTVNTQPACGYDLNLKKDLLFFCSNRAGGTGGFDIWYCTVERDGSFGEPVPLTSNSQGDDVAPHFVPKSQTLFFSSTKPGGKGGYDIYYSTKNDDGKWQPPVALDQLNSRFDELYFSYHQQRQTSYFSSNRPSANCQGQPSGCADFSIFTATLHGNLEVNTFSGLDSTALYGCNVELVNMDTKATEDSELKSENSKMRFAIEPDKRYRLIVSHDGFYPVFLDLGLLTNDFIMPKQIQVHLKPMR